MNSSLSPDPWMVSLALVVTGALTSVNQFFNYGKKAQKHSEYANLYSSLSNTVARELSIPKAHRQACDVFMERITARFEAIQVAAPDL